MPHSSKELVLILEDDEAVAVLERRALERRGFDVVPVGTLQDALTAIRARAFDLIVADYRLQNETGLELFEQIQQLGYDIPVIMVTGFSSEETVIEAIRRGVRDFVPKTTEYLQYLPDAVERVLKAVRTERELARSEARFKLFMDNSPAIAFLKDGEGRLIYANRRYAEECGNTSPLGKTDGELWPSKTTDELRINDAAALRADCPVQFEEAIARHDGALRYWSTYRFPVRDASGSCLLGGMAVDVTEQRKAEQALTERDEQLRQSQKMEAVGTLAGGVAHEFNNLLQAVLGYTRFAMVDLDSDDQRHIDLTVAVSAAERAAQLTQQLLSFSRRAPGQLTHVSPILLIQELTAMLRPLLGEGISIELALDENIEPFLADPLQLQQVLMNLCINARDAMPEGGRIAVSARELGAVEIDAPLPAPASGRYLAVSVSDTGVGMTPEVKQQIFEPFFTTKPVGKGTGLGLAMVYGAVQHHRGVIQVDSDLGVGTRFTFYLPLTSASAPVDLESHTGADDLGSETILVADDEPLVLSVSCRMLEALGYKVLAAQNGREAVRLFGEQCGDIDLVLLDMAMPELSGRDAYREIRALQPAVPVIFCTGYDAETTSAEVIGGAPPRLIRKPFSRDCLAAVVREVLEEANACLPN